MADISKPEEKSANFGLIGAAFGIGFVLGPLLGGLLAGYGTRAPFWAAGFLAAANGVFGYFVLPETVSDKIRRPFSWRRANPVGAFSNIGKLPGLKRLMLISFIYTIAFFVFPGVWAFFGAERFDWGPGMIGLSLGLFGIGIALVQGLLMKPILRRIGERRAVLLGLSADVAAFVLLAFVANGWIALLLTPLTALGSIAGPALQGIMSQKAADNQQGELQGTISAINAVATILAPLAVTQIFWFFTAPENPFYLPGAPFLLSALLTIGCIAIFLRMPRVADPPRGIVKQG